MPSKPQSTSHKHCTYSKPSDCEIEGAHAHALDKASLIIILRHNFYEYHYSHHKLAFQNTMRAGDQKLMIDLEWP